MLGTAMHAPTRRLQAGAVVDVPIILGNVRDEAVSFVWKLFPAAVPQPT